MDVPLIFESTVLGRSSFRGGRFCYNGEEVKSFIFISGGFGSGFRVRVHGLGKVTTMWIE